MPQWTLDIMPRQSFNPPAADVWVMGMETRLS